MLKSLLIRLSKGNESSFITIPREKHYIDIFARGDPALNGLTYFIKTGYSFAFSIITGLRELDN